MTTAVCGWHVPRRPHISLNYFRIPHMIGMGFLGALGQPSLILLVVGLRPIGSERR